MRLGWLQVGARALGAAAEELARLVSEDVGKPIRAARFEARRGAEFMEGCAAAAAGLSGEVLPVDLAANARSLGVRVIEVESRDDLEKAVRTAKEAPADEGPVLIHVNTDPLVYAPDSRSWWDVPVSEASWVPPARPPVEAMAALVTRVTWPA